jgi:hypothetical protein
MNSNHGAPDIGADMNISTGADDVVGLLPGSLGSKSRRPVRRP